MFQHALSLEVAAILREELQTPSIASFQGMELADMPGWDSVGMSCVMIALEGRFGIEFDGADIEQLTTFENLVALVGSKADLA